MKRTFFEKLFLSLALVLVATNGWAQQRQMAEVESLATGFAKQQMVRRVKGNGLIVPQVKLLNESTAKGFYLYSTSAEGGFVLISGDQRMTPILGYSDDAPVADMSELPENVAYWFGLYDKEYEMLQNGTRMSVPVHRAADYSYLPVEPIVTATWGQDSPFNFYCPKLDGKRSVTGCVSTAMSQLMYTFKYPACGTGKVSYTSKTNGFEISVDLSKYTFDWDLMKPNYYKTTYTDEERTAVAKLFYMAGASVNMDYDPSGSASSSLDGMYSLAKYFGFDSDMTERYASRMTETEWHQLLQSELASGHPLMYSGITKAGDGHTFIVDGYTPPASEADVPRYHVNWGWNGLYNGDFVLTNMTAAGETYSETHTIITGIQPDDSIQTSFSCFSGTSDLSRTTLKDSDMKSAKSTLKIFNNACRTFTGTIFVRLVNPNGKSKVIKKSTVSNVEPNYGFELVTTFTPDTIKGNYMIEAYSRAEGSETEEKIDLGGTKMINVISAADDLPYLETNLQATDFAINNLTTGGTISVTLSDVINLSTTKFVGEVKLAIADQTGAVMQVFGEGQPINGLSSYNMVTRPLTMSADMPAKMSDGQYRLYAVTSQDMYSGWTQMRKFALSGNSITDMDKPLYCDIWVKKGSWSLLDPEKEGTMVNLNFNISDGGAVVVGGQTLVPGIQTVEAVYASQPELMFVPKVGKQLVDVRVDGVSVIDQVEKLTYKMPELNGETTVEVEYGKPIEFQYFVHGYYNEANSIPKIDESGNYLAGSVLGVTVKNLSGVSIYLKGLYLSDGLSGVKSNNMLSTITTMPTGTQCNWGVTTGGNCTSPVVWLIYNARGQEYTISFGPKIADAIDNVTADDAELVGIYSMDGKRVSANAKGMKIYKYANGKTVKKF